MKTLAVERLASTDREQCYHICKMIASPGDAAYLLKVYDDEKAAIMKIEDPVVRGDRLKALVRVWSMRVSPCGRMAYLVYRGVEVRMFFKPQVLDEKEGEDAPDSQKKSDDVWIPIDLLGVSEDSGKLSKELASIKKELRQIRKQYAESKASFGKALAKQCDQMNQVISDAKKSKERYDALFRKKKGGKK